MIATTDPRTGRTGQWLRPLAWGAAALLLLTPAVAMQFTHEVQWTPLDFVFMGALLGGVGLAIEFAVRKSGNTAYRAAACAGLAACFLLIYLNAAVGIIGGEQEDANMLYGGVLMVALIGGVVARFRPAGMAWAMAAAALAQLLVPLLAAILVPTVQPVAGEAKVFVLTGMFTALWLLSAALFHRAAR